MQKHLWLAACGLVLGLTGPAFGQMTLPGKFEVTDTGAASYTIPISVVPGTAGLEPKLSLQYDSRSGNGLLGVGWSLAGLPSITRCGRTIAQDGAAGGVSYDANDRFCLDGQRLIAISGTYGAAGTEYRTERESFSKIISYGTAGSGPAWFKVWTKAGLIMEFGNSADSRIEAQGKSSVRVWAINRTSDTKGNYFTVSYIEDNANGEYRPDRIDYTGSATENTQPTNSIRFAYETRPDNVPLYQGGSIIKITQRMTKAQAWQSGNMVREYKLIYNPATDILLSQLTRVEFCDLNASCAAKTNFFFHAADGDKSFGPAVYTPLVQSNASIGWQASMADINGDGVADQVITRLDGAGWDTYIALGTGTGGFATPVYKMIDTGNYTNWPTSYVTDVNGDGLADQVAVRLDSAGWYSRVALGNGAGSFGIPAYTSLVVSNAATGWRPAIADVNGDGLTDLVITRLDGAGWDTYIALGTGTGGFATPVYKMIDTGNYTNWPTSYVTDVNGDGLADQVAVALTTSGWHARIALGSGSGDFAAPAYSGLVLSNASTGWQTRMADVNGDGMPDQVIIRLDTAGWDTYVAPMNGKMKLMLEIQSSSSAQTVIQQNPIAKTAGQYAKDTSTAACAYPCVDVQGLLYVVSEVRSSNGLGGEYRSTYRYAGAKADQHGRGFLGFRQMIVRDEQTGVEQMTSYRQDYPFTGLVASREKKLGTGLLNRSTNTYSSTELGGTRRYPFLTMSMEESWELNGQALPSVTTGYQYDAYGNATQVSVSTGDGHSKVTANTYHNDSTNWHLGRLTRSEVTSTTPGN